MRASHPEASWHWVTSPALHESVATVFDEEEQARTSSARAEAMPSRVEKNLAATRGESTSPLRYQISTAPAQFAGPTVPVPEGPLAGLQSFEARRFPGVKPDLLPPPGPC